MLPNARTFACTTVCILLLAACQSTQRSRTFDVRFTTDAEAYAPGDEVRLELTNGTDQDVGYNLCVSVLQRETDDGWEQAAEGETCTMVQRGLPPGSSASYTKHLEDGLPEGRYRFMTEIEYRGSSRQEPLGTNVFTVRP